MTRGPDRCAQLLFVRRLRCNPTAGAAGIGYGYPGTLLPDVCWAYQDAMLAGKLLPHQVHIGEAARAFLKALTNQAINDLIDRAIGFDKTQNRTINRCDFGEIRRQNPPAINRASCLPDVGRGRMVTPAKCPVEVR
jgi:hypothetical protein